MSGKVACSGRSITLLKSRITVGIDVALTETTGSETLFGCTPDEEESSLPRNSRLTMTAT